jgi:hypothetical protein
MHGRGLRRESVAFQEFSGLKFLPGLVTLSNESTSTWGGGGGGLTLPSIFDVKVSALYQRFVNRTRAQLLSQHIIEQRRELTCGALY